MLLRRALWHSGLRSYRVACLDIPGRPDVVFRRERIAVFCDGDFWHGRDLEARVARLARGHNAPYWTSKIRRNVERDRVHDAKLAETGWTVLRYWESEIRSDPAAVAQVVTDAVAAVRGATARRDVKR